MSAHVEKTTGKRWFPVVLVLVVFMIGSFMFLLIPEFGDLPKGDHLRAISTSPQYDPISKRFINRRQTEYDVMMDNFAFGQLLKKQIFGKEQRKPKQPLPQVKPDLDAFIDSDVMLYHWLGHSTMLIRLNQQTILIDPVFGNAAPVPFAVNRFEKPVLKRSDLPPIDLILISHDHYDHLERKTILHFKNKATKFIVPLGVSAYLKGWGIDPSRITELDWWEETRFKDLTIACTPSQHFSGRRGPKGNKTLWASWTVIGTKERFYFSGDSGYDTHFVDIGKRYGPFDVVFMESGQYNPIWPMSHMFPQESVAAAVDLKAKSIQPIHWGMFKLSTHDWFEPADLVLTHAKKTNLNVFTPIIGQSVAPSNPPVFEPWWVQTHALTKP